MTKSLTLRLNKWDEHIRIGELDLVRTEIKKLNLSDIDRSDRIGVAKICRRVQLYQLATKVLFAVVRDQESGRANPSSHEIAEYSASLIGLGSVREANALLLKADPLKCPEVLLNQSFVHMTAWNFEGAVESLNQYLTSPLLTEYQRQVANVNLASSLVGCQRYEEALTLLRTVLDQAKSNGFSLIYTTGLCHLAGLHLEMRDHSAARITVDLARRSVPPSDFQHNLLLDKIRAKLGADTGAARVTPELFDEIKLKALKFKIYEIARDCDFAKVKWFGDQAAFLAVYVGTMNPSFRMKFSSLNLEYPTEGFFVRTDVGRIDAFDKAPLSFLDLRAPRDPGSSEITYRFLAALNQDFYRPLTMGEMFEVLFPKTYFDPFTSPARLNQIIRRTRNWLKKMAYPVSIRLDERGLVLVNSPDLPLRVSADRMTLTRTAVDQALIQAYTSFGSERFQMDDFVRQSACTKGQAWPYLRTALDRGLLAKVGQGRYTFYYFIRQPAED